MPTVPAAEAPAPGAEVALRPLSPVAARAPASCRLDRTWLVSWDGEVEVVAGRWPPPAANVTGRVVHPPGRRGPHIAAAIGPRVAPQVGRRRSAFAGLGVVAGIVGLGLVVGLTGQPTASAVDSWAAADTQPAAPAALPAGPAAEFVYPVLPAPGGVPPVPAGPVDLGLAYLGPGLVVPPAVAVPAVPLFTTPPTAVSSVGPGAVLGGGSAGGADAGGVASGQSTTPSTSTGAGPTPVVAAPGPVAVQVQGQRVERLVPVGSRDGTLPEVLLGRGVGLWSGGTGDPVVVVLGAEHAAVADLTAPGAGRRITVVLGDGEIGEYGLSASAAEPDAAPVPLTRTEAVALLARIEAPLVLFVRIGEAAVTLMEAVPVEPTPAAAAP